MPKVSPRSKSVRIKTPSPPESPKSPSGVKSAVFHGHVTEFMKQLSNLSEQRCLFDIKIATEKARGQKLDESVNTLKIRIAQYQEQIVKRSGMPEKTDNYHNDKKIELLEKEIARTKIKLNVLRTENLSMRDKITCQRQEKQMKISVKMAFDNELITSKEKNSEMKKELAEIGSKTHTVKSQLRSLKSSIAKESTVFQREIHLNKGALFDTQDAVLSTVREHVTDISESISRQNTSTLEEASSIYDSLLHSRSRLHYENKVSPRLSRSLSKSRPTSAKSKSSIKLTNSSLQMETTQENSPLKSSSTPKKSSSKHVKTEEKGKEINEVDIKLILEQSGVKSIDELIRVANENDKASFEILQDVQALHVELDNLENSNKDLQKSVETTVKSLEDVEKTNIQTRSNLEHEIDVIQSNIVKYEMKFSDHLDLLNQIGDSLSLLVKNLGREESYEEQKLLTVGLNDRNIVNYLALLEERIDLVIQMGKAAVNQPLAKTDFYSDKIPEKTADPSAIPGLANPVAVLMSLATPTLDEESISSGKSKEPRPVNIATLKASMTKMTSLKLPSAKNGGVHFV